VSAKEGHDHDRLTTGLTEIAVNTNRQAAIPNGMAASSSNKTLAQASTFQRKKA
jgi:hypothetical protein